MRAAAAAAAVMGAMVPPFEDMPGDEPGTSRGKRPPDTPEGGLCTMPDGIRPHQKGQAMAIVFATPEPIKSMPVQSSIAGMPRRPLSSVITGSARRALVSNRIGLEAIFRICAELGKKCAVSSRIQPRRDEAIDANRCRSETCSAPRACLCRQCEWRETHDAMLSWGNQIYAQCHCPKAGRETVWWAGECQAHVVFTIRASREGTLADLPESMARVLAANCGTARTMFRRVGTGIPKYYIEID